MAWKASVRLHKLFAAEVERAERLDREGEQVLSSLANVSQRVPLLARADSDALGVVALSGDARERLLRRHLVALDKSRAFLAAVERDYAELVAGLPPLLSDALAALAALLDADGPSDGALGAMRRLEWMEDVAGMLQRELARKQALVGRVELHDAAQLAALHAQWPSRSRWSNVSADYVRSGLEPVPTLPKGEEGAGSRGGDEQSKKKPKKKKKKQTDKGQH